MKQESFLGLGTCIVIIVMAYLISEIREKHHDIEELQDFSGYLESELDELKSRIEDLEEKIN